MPEMVVFHRLRNDPGSSHAHVVFLGGHQMGPGKKPPSLPLFSFFPPLLFVCLPFFFFFFFHLSGVSFVVSEHGQDERDQEGGQCDRCRIASEIVRCELLLKGRPLVEALLEFLRRVDGRRAVKDRLGVLPQRRARDGELEARLDAGVVVALAGAGVAAVCIRSARLRQVLCDGVGRAPLRDPAANEPLLAPEGRERVMAAVLTGTPGEQERDADAAVAEARFLALEAVGARLTVLLRTEQDALAGVSAIAPQVAGRVALWPVVLVARLTGVDVRCFEAAPRVRPRAGVVAPGGAKALVDITARGPDRSVDAHVVYLIAPEAGFFADSAGVVVVLVARCSLGQVLLTDLSGAVAEKALDAAVAIACGPLGALRRADVGVVAVRARPADIVVAPVAAPAGIAVLEAVLLDASPVADVVRVLVLSIPMRVEAGGEKKKAVNCFE